MDLAFETPPCWKELRCPCINSWVSGSVSVAAQTTWRRCGDCASTCPRRSVEQWGNTMEHLRKRGGSGDRGHAGPRQCYWRAVIAVSIEGPNPPTDQGQPG